MKFISFFIYIILIAFLAIPSFGQTPVKLMIGGGHSFSGTGDVSGYTVLNEVELRLSKRFFLSPGLQFTNHSKTEILTYHQLRYVTTGINFYTNINYLLLNKPRHHIALGVGPALRLQTTSEPSQVSVSTSASGEPILALEYDDPISTLSLGYNISPSYYYQLSNRLFLGAKLMLQNDTRGDIITSEMLFIGVNLF